LLMKQFKELLPVLPHQPIELGLTMLLPHRLETFLILLQVLLERLFSDPSDHCVELLMEAMVTCTLYCCMFRPITVFRSKRLFISHRCSWNRSDFMRVICGSLRVRSRKSSSSTSR
jgi:hypothetical protein